MPENKDTIISDVENAMESIRRRLPSYDPILTAFRELFIERASLKSDLQAPALPASFAIDPLRFAQGESVFIANGYPKMELPQWETAIERIFPALEAGFPQIAHELIRINHAALSDQFNFDHLIESILTYDEQAFSKRHPGFESPFPLLAFVLGQCIKPFMEKQAEAFKPYCEPLNWQKGYCPVCGSYPELSILKAPHGERWLRCSCCAYQWHYIRVACPVCENNQPDHMELVFLEDRPYERAELCYGCHKYVLGVDMRKMTGEIMRDILPLSLLHLDILAREKGCQAMGVNPLNSVHH